MKDVQEDAIRALSEVRRNKNGHRNPRISLIVLALKSKKVDMSKVIKMIDDMVVLLGKEQGDDDTKKAFCEAEFDKMDDKKKGLEREIGNLEKALEEYKSAVETLGSEIEALSEGIKKLDQEVVQATEQRKEENE